MGPFLQGRERGAHLGQSSLPPASPCRGREAGELDASLLLTCMVFFIRILIS